MKSWVIAPTVILLILFAYFFGRGSINFPFADIEAVPNRSNSPATSVREHTQKESPTPSKKNRDDPVTAFEQFASEFVSLTNAGSANVLGSSARYNVVQTESLLYPVHGVLLCRKDDRAWVLRFGLRSDQWELLDVQIGDQDRNGNIVDLRPTMPGHAEALEYYVRGANAAASKR